MSIPRLFCLLLNQYEMKDLRNKSWQASEKILRHHERDFFFDQIFWDGDFFLRPNISIPIQTQFLFNCWLLITMDNAPLHLCSSHHRNQWFSEARLDACYRQRRAEPLLYHTRLKSCNSQHATTHRHQGCINVPGWEFFFSKLFYAFVVICSSQ